jgi:transposase
MSKNNNQPVNKEAFKMLATEIGLNAACRKLGVPIPTGKSWARRGKWNLPKRPGGRPPRTLDASQSDANQMPIAAALDATHKELEGTTKTALMRTLSKAAKKVASEQALDVSNTAQLRDICLAAARMFGWGGDGKATVTVNAEKAVIVCDEARRNELIKQRQRLLEAEAEKRVPGRTVEVPTAANQETQPKGNVSAENGTAAQDQKPTVQQRPFYRHMEAIGKGESLRTGKGSEQWSETPVVTDFMPWPEEYQ